MSIFGDGCFSHKRRNAMNLIEKVSKWISTKVDKDSDAVKTNLTFDFSGLTEDDIKEYAIMHLVVKWQDQKRRANSIPVADTYKVPKPGTKTQADPTGVAKAVLMSKGYTAEQADEILNSPAFRERVQQG